jgi:hypothetical protein
MACRYQIYRTGISVLEAFSRTCLGNDWWTGDNQGFDTLTEVDEEIFLSMMAGSAQEDGVPFDDVQRYLKLIKPMGRRVTWSPGAHLVLSELEKVSVLKQREHSIIFDGYQIIETIDGFIGFAPRETREGDLVAILQGYSRPVILRRAENQPLRYHFIGPTHVEGLARGETKEFLDSWERVPQRLEIY